MLTANNVSTIGRSILMATAIKASGAVKASFIVGSYTSFFSLVSITAPLAGAIGGMPGALITAVASFALRGAFAMPSAHFLAYFVPGFCASLYWAHPSALVRVWLPVACMALFMLHPVGSAAFVYSLYWLIPVALFYSGAQSPFSIALGSTFVAHAVGSVIWLYTMPTDAAMWIGLIPVVACERLVFATGMAVCYQAAVQITQYVRGMRVCFMVGFKHL